MCKILLSIKPEYSQQILQGTKKYEFRRQIAKRTVDEILIYSTSPEMKVIGSVEVIEVISAQPSELWQKTKDVAGINKEKFMNYFFGKKLAHAYKLGKIQNFNPPKSLSDYGVKTAPQSFVYI